MYSIIIAISLVGCDKETLISNEDLPNEIKSYITTHFPNQSILQVVRDRDGFIKAYDIILDNLTSLEFNMTGNFLRIDN